MQISIFRNTAALALLLACGNTSGAAADGSAAILDEARRRAANSLPESAALQNPVFQYRSVHMVGEGQPEAIVCGEVKEENSDSWTRFHMKIADDRLESDPHPKINVAASDWFSEQCTQAVRALKPGGRGTTEQMHQCAAASLFAEVKYERSRFNIIHDVFCGN